MMQPPPVTQNPPAGYDVRRLVIESVKSHSGFIALKIECINKSVHSHAYATFQ